MPLLDPERIAKAIVTRVRTALVSFDARVTALETRAVLPGPPGRDADPIDVDLVAAKAAALVPVPKDGENGKDAAPIDYDLLATKASKFWHVPSDGRDGKDGRSFSAGDGAPQFEGKSGDAYLDAKTGDVYTWL